MTPHVLTLNAGSSSIKFALFDPPARLDRTRRGAVERLGGEAQLHYRPAGDAPADSKLTARGRDHAPRCDAALRRPPAPRRRTRRSRRSAIASCMAGRIRRPARIDDPVYAALKALEAARAAAPAAQPRGRRAARALFPDAPQVACFDTAFHRGHAFVNDAYALPREFYDEGLRRYGFHGLSYEYVSAGFARSTAKQRRAASSSPISATAPRCARLRDGRSVASHHGLLDARRPADGHAARPDSTPACCSI